MSEFHEEELYGAIARGWCDEHNSSKTVDVILADAIAIEVLALVRPLSAENERLKALGKEVMHDNGTLSQNNMDLRKRNAKLEKVAEAARTRRTLCPHKFIPEVIDEEGWDECCTREGCGADYDNCAALAEMETPDDRTL